MNLLILTALFVVAVVLFHVGAYKLDDFLYAPAKRAGPALAALVLFAGSVFVFLVAAGSFMMEVFDALLG